MRHQKKSLKNRALESLVVPALTLTLVSTAAISFLNPNYQALPIKETKKKPLVIELVGKEGSIYIMKYKSGTSQDEKKSNLKLDSIDDFLNFSFPPKVSSRNAQVSAPPLEKLVKLKPPHELKPKYSFDMKSLRNFYSQPVYQNDKKSSPYNLIHQQAKRVNKAVEKKNRLTLTNGEVLTMKYAVKDGEKRLDTVYKHLEKVDPRLIASVVLAESAGNPHAASNKDAKGFMGVKDNVCDEFGVSDKSRENPEDNLTLGITYFSRLSKTFASYGDKENAMKLALAAFNYGIGNVRQKISDAKTSDYDMLRKLLPKETTDYIDRVMNMYSHFRRGGQIKNFPYLARN